MKQIMKTPPKPDRIYFLWWGWPFRFRITQYLPGCKIFKSIDIGPIEIRIYQRMKFRYPTAGPMIAFSRRLFDRGKIKSKGEKK
jgi:hypothetical protein